MGTAMFGDLVSYDVGGTPVAAFGIVGFQPSNARTHRTEPRLISGLVPALLAEANTLVGLGLINEYLAVQVATITLESMEHHRPYASLSNYLLDPLSGQLRNAV
ncbi:MAG: hypothetical protein RLN75_04485, partial [Longimicrobiales bacterium]